MGCNHSVNARSGKDSALESPMQRQSNATEDAARDSKRIKALNNESKFTKRPLAVSDRTVSFSFDLSAGSINNKSCTRSLYCISPPSAHASKSISNSLSRSLVNMSSPYVSYHHGSTGFKSALTVNYSPRAGIAQTVKYDATNHS